MFLGWHSSTLFECTLWWHLLFLDGNDDMNAQCQIYNWKVQKGMCRFFQQRVSFWSQCSGIIYISALTIVCMCRFFQHFVITLCVLLVFGFGYWLVSNVCTRAEKSLTELWYYRTKLPINSIFLSFLINYSIVFREFMCECLHWISKCACKFWG